MIPQFIVSTTTLRYVSYRVSRATPSSPRIVAFARNDNGDTPIDASRDDNVNGASTMPPATAR
jgi:hypothetical protein